MSFQRSTDMLLGPHFLSAIRLVTRVIVDQGRVYRIYSQVYISA